MSEPRFFIRTMDEGHSAIVNVSPEQRLGNTATMVNPQASTAVLIDAAQVRAFRVEAITRAFHFLNLEATAELPADVISDVMTAINGLSHEAARLLDAAQYRNAHSNDGGGHE